MGLQPIETAPRDGSRILLARESGYADGYWLASAYNGNGAWIWPYVHKVPLYWMPLPELPSNAEVSGRPSGRSA